MKTQINLNEFLFKSKERVTQKINSFKKSGKEKIHIVLDFDKTLVMGKNQKGENITVWDAIEKFVSKELQMKSIRLYKKYRPLEMKRKLSEKQAIKWWEWNLNIFKGIKSSEIEKASHIIETRPFVKEFFILCKKKKIPTIIISASVKNIIDLWCQREKIKPTKVLSTELFFHNGRVSGWKRETLIHSLNKREKGHKEIKKIKVKRPKTILIGDSLDDVYMVEGDKNVIRIAIYDTKDSYKGNLKEFINQFDLVFKGNNFRPMLKILNLF
jgi:HAD superfamily phosphoserine phosphatase-like hydrolase